MPNIKFISNGYFSNEESDSLPLPISRVIPKWYRDHDRFAKDDSGDFYLDRSGWKIPTWKACPSIYDAITFGYTLRLPCDIKFFINDAGNIDVEILDKRFDNFIERRPALDGFPTPDGYHDNHFAWYPDWGVSVSNGHSVLYTTPLNRFDLPFINTSGVIDNDKLDFPGTMPFFIKKDWEGIIPSGTEYMQLIPFKREDWKSSYSVPKIQEISQRYIDKMSTYDKKNGGVYQSTIWSKRRYN